MARQYLSTLLDWLFPKHCVGCNKTDDYLCPNCIALLPPAEETPAALNFAVFAYNDPRLKRAVWLLKYRGVKTLAPLFAKLIYGRLAECLAEWKSLYPGEEKRWLLVPIPQSKSRERQRGFNQATEIARELLRQEPKVFTLAPDVLRKIKETKSQVSLGNREKRLNNLRGAFAVNQPELIAGQHVIVIDDVITTGGTMSEARRALRAAGAKRILGAALAAG